MAEVLQMDRKHWEKEKLLVRSNLSFFHSVFKRPVLQTRKNHGFFGKGLRKFSLLTKLMFFFCCCILESTSVIVCLCILMCTKYQRLHVTDYNRFDAILFETL